MYTPRSHSGVTPATQERLRMLNGSGLVVLQSSDHFNAGASARVAAQHAVSPRAAVAVKGYVERVRMHRHNLRTLFISLGHDAGSGLVSIADVANGLRHAPLPRA